jgi:RimJ/RimL family protein N-acetyltransferase
MDEIDLQNRSVRVGADVAVLKRRQGYGVGIYEALKKYCFDDLGMHRIWLLVLETNRPARALYRKVGFAEEGRMKKAIWRGGCWVDYVSMSTLKEG